MAAPDTAALATDLNMFPCSHHILCNGTKATMSNTRTRIFNKEFSSKFCHHTSSVLATRVAERSIDAFHLFCSQNASSRHDSAELSTLLPDHVPRDADHSITPGSSSPSLLFANGCNELKSERLWSLLSFFCLPQKIFLCSSCQRVTRRLFFARIIAYITVDTISTPTMSSKPKNRIIRLSSFHPRPIRIIPQVTRGTR